MLLSIHNLPAHTHYSDVKELIISKCGLHDSIIDNLVNDGGGMKVTVGVLEEEDAALLVRKLNGLYYKGQQLYVEDKRKIKDSEQPYRNQPILQQPQLAMQFQQAVNYNPQMQQTPLGMYNYSMFQPPPVGQTAPNNYMAYGNQGQAHLQPLMPQYGESVSEFTQQAYNQPAQPQQRLDPDPFTRRSPSARKRSNKEAWDEDRHNPSSAPRSPGRNSENKQQSGYRDSRSRDVHHSGGFHQSQDSHDKNYAAPRKYDDSRGFVTTVYDSHDGQASSRGGNASSGGGYASSRGGNAFSRGGHASSRGGNASSRGGNASSRGGNDSFRGGHASRGGYDSRTEHASSRDGYGSRSDHASPRGGNSSRGGYNSRGGHISSRGGYDSSPGEHNSSRGEYDSRGGYGSSRGEHTSSRREHNSRDGHASNAYDSHGGREEYPRSPKQARWENSNEPHESQPQDNGREPRPSRSLHRQQRKPPRQQQASDTDLSTTYPSGSPQKLNKKSISRAVLFILFEIAKNLNLKVEFEGIQHPAKTALRKVLTARLNQVANNEIMELNEYYMRYRSHYPLSEDVELFNAVLQTITDEGSNPAPFKPVGGGSNPAPFKPVGEQFRQPNPVPPPRAIEGGFKPQPFNPGKSGSGSVWARPGEAGFKPQPFNPGTSGPGSVRAKPEAGFKPQPFNPGTSGPGSVWAKPGEGGFKPQPFNPGTSGPGSVQAKPGGGGFKPQPFNPGTSGFAAVRAKPVVDILRNPNRKKKGPSKPPPVIPGKIPSYAGGDKKSHKVKKRQNQQDMAALEGYELTYTYQEALDAEVSLIEELFKKELKSLQAEDIEVYKNIDKEELINTCKKVVSHNLSRRLSNNGVKVLRIYGSPKLPARVPVEQYFINHNFGCIALKRSLKAPFYTAEFNSYDTIDRLVNMGPLVINDCVVNFKHMHEGPKQQKRNLQHDKMLRKKYIESLIEISEVNLLDKNWQIQEEAAKKREEETKTQNSETKTQNSETETQNSETETRNSETETRNSETKTENSETNTENSETNTENSETKSQNSETKTQNARTRTRKRRQPRTIEGEFGNAPESDDVICIGERKYEDFTVDITCDGEHPENKGSVAAEEKVVPTEPAGNTVFLNEEFQIIDEVKGSDNDVHHEPASVSEDVKGIDDECDDWDKTGDDWDDVAGDENDASPDDDKKTDVNVGGGGNDEKTVDIKGQKSDNEGQGYNAADLDWDNVNEDDLEDY